MMSCAARSRWRTKCARGDDDPRRGDFRHPLDGAGEALTFPLPTAQQRAIAAANEIEAGLDQADGAAAQIVRFPALVWNRASSEQAPCDLPIAADPSPAIRRTHGQYEPTPTLDRQSKRRRAERTRVKCRPKPVSCPRAHVEIVVERQLERKRGPIGRKVSQPKPMARAAQRHDGVPSILRTAKLAARKPGQVERMSALQRRATRTDRKHGRQRLRRPENRLAVESLLRISREKTAPIAVAARRSSGSMPHTSMPHNLCGSHDFGEAPPRQARLRLPAPCWHTLRVISNPAPALCSSPRLRPITIGRIATHNCDYF